MTQSEIIEAIRILVDVVNANKGWCGNEYVATQANNKISELIKLIKP